MFGRLDNIEIWMEHNQCSYRNKKESFLWACPKIKQFGALHAETNDLYYKNFGQIGQIQLDLDQNENY